MTENKQRKLSRRGVTLIEMMVVVTIIARMPSAQNPMLARIIESAGKIECRTAC